MHDGGGNGRERRNHPSVPRCPTAECMALPARPDGRLMGGTGDAVHAADGRGGGTRFLPLFQHGKGGGELVPLCRLTAAPTHFASAFKRQDRGKSGWGIRAVGGAGRPLRCHHLVTGATNPPLSILNMVVEGGGRFSAAGQQAVHKALPCQQPRPKTTNEAELRRVFSTFDHNDDGLITRQELQDSLENLGLFVSEADLDSMVARLDINGDGALDLQEFCVLYESVNVSGRRDGGAGSGRDGEGLGGELVGEDQELKEAFDVFDVNGDGFITVEELGSVLSSMGLRRRASRTQLAEMIGTVDADGDGRVSLAEFQQMMKAGAAGISPLA
ncbi:Calmodulin-like protein 5 [Nymphaea thermarum]|nr:Calmodulin-like protein 5 [Nymphaea thermarum]